MYQNDFEFVRLFKAYGRILDFKGRSTRTELLGYWIATWVLSTASNFLLVPAVGPTESLIALSMLVSAVILVPAPALAVRRAHDVGWPGSAAMLLILPAMASTIFGPALEPYKLVRILLAVAYIGGIVMLLWKPQDGENRYGPDPRLAEESNGEEH